MKARLADLLVCPLDKTALELVVWETRDTPLSEADHARAKHHGIAPDKLSREIVTGLLLNKKRQIAYPIYQSIPRMLVFETGVARDFVAKHGKQLARELPGYSMPHEQANPGEKDTLRTFSSEWVNYDWDGQSYWNLTPERWYECMRFMLDFEHKPVTQKLVLEVGIGIGGVADHHARSEGCELVGIDLGYAVDSAQNHFGQNPFLHIVQASALAPPFRDSTFDLVYSFGVIMCSYSTKATFDCLANLPKPGGRLNIWVYSPHNEQRSLLRRSLMRVENIVRPMVWRLPERLQSVALSPFIPLYIGYARFRKLRGGEGYIRYGWREAMHAARDRFTPRYLHRHSDGELSSWFRDAGYDSLEVASERQRPSWVPIGFTANAGVEGMRTAVARPQSASKSSAA